MAERRSLPEGWALLQGGGLGAVAAERAAQTSFLMRVKAAIDGTTFPPHATPRDIVRGLDAILVVELFGFFAFERRDAVGRRFIRELGTLYSIGSRGQGEAAELVICVAKSREERADYLWRTLLATHPSQGLR